jgi:hypothetical protein
MAEPVALGIKPPQPMSLGDMLNIARGAQAYQQTEQTNPLALQKAQMEIEQLQKTNPLAVRQQAALATTAETGATKGQAELQAYYKDQSRKAYGGLLTDKDFDPLNPNLEGMKVKLQETGDFLTNVMGVPEHESKAQAKLLKHIDDHGVTGAQRVIQQIANGVQQSGTTSEQFAQANRAPLQLETGAQTILKPISRYQMGQPILTQEKELPPTTEVVTPTGATKLLGPLSQRGTTDLTTGLGPSQSGLLKSGGEVIAQDWEKTSLQAKDAPTRIGIFQNIKKLSPEAFTGVGGQRKELAAGILNAVGISAYEAEKVSTEELAKNSALLALAGGNTDAARALAEIANPNKKLNEKAIRGVADQLIGVEKMYMARQNYLAPVQNDATQYAQRKQQFDAISDARLFQEMSKEDVAKLKASMSKEEQDDLTRKVKLARQIGVIK